MSIDWANEPDVVQLKLAKSMLKTDSKQALQNLETLARQGSLMSMVYLGWAYGTGDGLGRDPKKAEEWYRKAAGNGSILGRFYLGVHLLNGEKMGQAVREFEIGSEDGFPPSMDRLGKMHFYGIGMPPDRSRARELWERAARLGHVRAKRRLGFAMAGGKYGFSNIPRGMVMVISVIGDIYRVASRDPQSELLM